MSRTTIKTESAPTNASAKMLIFLDDMRQCNEREVGYSHKTARPSHF